MKAARPVSVVTWTLWIVAAGCGPDGNGSPSVAQKAETVQASKTVARVGGEYWTAHFFGDDTEPSVMNFMDYGIIPVTLSPDGKVAYGGRYKGRTETWTLEGDTVTIKRKQGPPWTLKVTERGDVLVSEPPIEYGVPDNRVRLLRDDPMLHVRYVGRYRRVSRAVPNVPAEIEIGEKTWSSKEPGFQNLPWLVAGPFVVLIGPEPKGTMVDYESFILRPSKDLTKLSLDLSKYKAVYGEDLSVVYERVP
ncbi:MAG: hypothetical protein JST30_12205 [Armatimonadetes bacterium]|nr:hypothetical protein [Armatimonadota bacterium]